MEEKANSHGRASRQRRLVYSEDVDLNDVQAIEEFLSARTARLAGAERGSDERHAARSMRAAIHLLVGQLQYGIPLASAASSEPGVQMSLRREVHTCWNTLWALASPWQWHEHFDHERWRYVRYWDSRHEAEFDAALAREFQRERRGYRSRGARR